MVCVSNSPRKGASSPVARSYATARARVAAPSCCGHPAPVPVLKHADAVTAERRKQPTRGCLEKVQFTTTRNPASPTLLGARSALGLHLTWVMSERPAARSLPSAPLTFSLSATAQVLAPSVE